jgi:hypothetical protein
MKVRFDALHLLHRCLHIIIPDFYTNPASFDEAKDLLATCYFFVRVYNFDFTEPFPRRRSPKYVVSDETLRFNAIKILANLGCVLLSSSLWDYANCAEDLPALYTRTKSCNYDPSKIEGSYNTGHSKNIDFYEFVELKLDAPIIPVEYPTIEIPRESKRRIERGWWLKVENWRESRESMFTRLTYHSCIDSIAILRYNQSCLPELSDVMATTIYEILYYWKDKYGTYIDKLFPYFDWRSISKVKENPWRVIPR